MKFLHLGFSIWFNLDIIATKRPDYAVVFDIDPSVYRFVYPAIQSVIGSSNSREGFITKLLSTLLVNEGMRPWTEIYTLKFNQLMAAPYGFLAS